MKDSLDKLVEEINSKRCVVSTLIQASMDEWFASIRKIEKFSTGDGKGNTAYEALSNAWNLFTPEDAFDRSKSKSFPKNVNTKKRKRIKVK